MKPYIGMPVAVYMYSDRKAYTVVKVSKTGAKISIRRVVATRVDNNGMSDCQDYTFTEDENGEILTANRQGDGSYRCPLGRVCEGHREYHDFSF